MTLDFDTIRPDEDADFLIENEGSELMDESRFEEYEAQSDSSKARRQ